MKELKKKFVKGNKRIKKPKEDKIHPLDRKTTMKVSKHLIKTLEEKKKHDRETLEDVIWGLMGK